MIRRRNDKTINLHDKKITYCGNYMMRELYKMDYIIKRLQDYKTTW